MKRWVKRVIVDAVKAALVAVLDALTKAPSNRR